MAKTGLNKRIWDRIQGFLDGGQSYVLSMNHTEHIEKMKTSRYAYLSDATILQIEGMSDCSLKLLPKNYIEQTTYRFALRNNSAYGDIMSKM